MTSPSTCVKEVGKSYVRYSNEYVEGVFCEPHLTEFSRKLHGGLA